MFKKILSHYKNIILFGILAAIIGLITGSIDFIFGKVLLNITDFREENFIKLIPFLSLIGLFIIFLYNRYGKNSIKGMSLVFATAHQDEDRIPLRLVPFTILSTWLTHLFGGSAGREGVAVQIGAAVSHNIGNLIPIKDSKKIFLLTGMAAGFAGLFQTPIAATLFALEVLSVGILEYSALFPAMIGSFVASYTSHALGLEKFSFALNSGISVNPQNILKILLVGIIFGMVGGSFAYTLNLAKKYFTNKFENPYKKIFINGIILTILLMLFHYGRYSGLGTNLISNSFHGDKIYSYDWILKFVLTIFTLSIGFQGGEVTPLFSIGSSLGIVLASILGLPFPLIAALGYSSVFAGATNTFLAPIFIGTEVFGYEYLPFFFLSCAMAYTFNGNKSIYPLQKNS